MNISYIILPALTDRLLIVELSFHETSYLFENVSHNSCWVFMSMNSLLHWNVHLLSCQGSQDSRQSVCVFVWVCVSVGVCIHKNQKLKSTSLSLSVLQQNQLLYWGPPLQTVYEGIRGSLTAPSNTHPAWPPRLWPLDTLKMRLRWKEGVLRAFPRDEFDHTSSKNESIIQNPTKARVEAVLECCASLLREALCFYCFHWAWECHNND